MKQETVTALNDYINAVTELAAGCILQTGTETFTKLQVAAENLKLELENEEVV